MTAGQRTLLLALILVLGVGAFFAWSTSSGPTEQEVIDAPVPNLNERQMLTDAGSSGARINPATLEQGGPSGTTETTVEWPLEVRLTLAHPGAFDGSELPPPRSDANARLRGHLRGEKGSSVSGVVTFLAGPNEGRELITDDQGRFGATDLYQGLSLVRIEASTGVRCEREVSLRQLAMTDLNVDLSRRARSHVMGTVVDMRGTPIEGAEVRLDGGTSFTNDLGEFEFASVTPGKVPISVKKHGYARHYEQNHIMHGRPVKSSDLTIRLHPSVDLELRLAAAVGSPGPVQVFLVPVGGHTVGSGLFARNFPWHEINPIEVHPGGSTRVEGLQEGHVSILAFHPGAVASPPLVNKKLSPDRENTHLVQLRPAPTAIRGTVKNPDGTPAANANLRLEDATRGFASIKAMQQRRPEMQMGYVGAHLPAAVQTVRADSHGKFVLTTFPEVTPKGYYLSASSPDGSMRVTRTVKPEAAEIDLQLEAIEAVAGSLTLHMGGRYQGLPVDLWINGQPQSGGVLPADKPLVVQGLEPGLWRIEARWHQEVLEEGMQFEVKEQRSTTLPLVLPLGAIEGPPTGETPGKTAGE